MSLEELYSVYFNAPTKGRPGVPVGKLRALEKQAEGTVTKAPIIYSFLKFQGFLFLLMTK